MTTAHPFETNLLGHLETLLSGGSTITEFRHWFSRAWWDAETAGVPDELFDFAAGIEHFGYILDSGFDSESNYLERLREATDAFRVRI